MPKPLDPTPAKSDAITVVNVHGATIARHDTVQRIEPRKQVPPAVRKVTK